MEMISQDVNEDASSFSSSFFNNNNDEEEEGSLEKGSTLNSNESHLRSEENPYYDELHSLGVDELMTSAAAEPLSTPLTVPYLKYAPLVPSKTYVVPGNNVKTRSQLTVLERLFRQSVHPKRNDILQLCAESGLEYNECLAWFKFKRKSLQLDPQAAQQHAAAIGEPIIVKKGTKRKYKVEEVSRLSLVPPINHLKNTPKILAKKAHDWAAQYSTKDDALEQDYMMSTLVEQLSSKQRKQLRQNLLRQPLQLMEAQDQRPRKSSADPSLTRRTIITRSEQAWDHLATRFGSLREVEDEEAKLDHGEGYFAAFFIL